MEIILHVDKHNLVSEMLRERGREREVCDMCCCLVNFGLHMYCCMALGWIECDQGMQDKSGRANIFLEVNSANKNNVYILKKLSSHGELPEHGVVLPMILH